MRHFHLTSILLVCCYFSLNAQVRLNVAGDALIQGRLELFRSPGDSSLFIGTNAGLNDDGTNNDNTFVGTNAGQATIGGYFNTFLGSKAGTANTTGFSNTLLGALSGYFNVDGVDNAFVGALAGFNNQSGSLNTFLGTVAGFTNVAGTRNTFVGKAAGYSNDFGINNTFLGMEAGFSNTTGPDNTFVGQGAGFANTTGQANVAVGTAALRLNTDRSGLVAVGDSALYHNGVGATQSHQAKWNTAIGSKALHSNTIGFYNTATGRSALSSNIDGYSNTATGMHALFSNTTGYSNTATGFNALSSNIDGYSNTAIGWLALSSNIDGYSNTALGYFADVSASNLQYSTALGARAIVGCSNCLVLGGTGQSAVKVGIGVTTPSVAFTLLAPGAVDPVGITQNQVGGESTMELTTEDGSEVQTTRILIRGGQDEANIEFYRGPRGQEAQSMIIEGSDGRVGIGKTPANNAGLLLDVNGDIFSSGSLVTSDRRFKQQVSTIPEALSKLLQLRGVSFRFDARRFKERNFAEGLRLGLIAQEIETVFPELVATDEQGFKAVNYDGLIPVIIEAMKEQERELEELQSLKNDNETLRKENEALKSRMDELESLMRQVLAQNQEPETTHSQTIQLRAEAQLYQNRPNPFGEQTVISYYIPEGITKAQLRISAPDGKVLRLVDISGRGPGQTVVQIEGLAAGAYAYSLLLAGRVFETRQLVIQR